MRKTAALALHSFRECLHSKASLIIVVYAGLIILSYVFLGAVDGSDRVKVLESLSFVAMSVFGAFLAAVIPVLSLSEEIQTKKVYNVLTKPVGRFTFLTGKAAGILAFVSAFTVIMAFVSYCAVALAAARSQDKPVRAAHRMKYAVSSELVRDDGSRTILAKTTVLSNSSDFASARWTFGDMRVRDREADQLRCRLTLSAHGTGAVFGIDYSRIHVQAVNPESGERYAAIQEDRSRADSDYIIVPRDGEVEILVPGDAVAGNGSFALDVLRPGSRYKLFPGPKSASVYLESSSHAVNFGKAVLLLILKFAFITCVSLCGGAFFSATSGLCFAVSVIVMSNLLQFLKGHAPACEELFYSRIFLLFRLVCPDFGRFERGRDVIGDVYIPWRHLGYAALLAVMVYSLAYLSIAYFGLKDREF